MFLVRLGWRNSGQWNRHDLYAWFSQITWMYKVRQTVREVLYNLFEVKIMLPLVNVHDISSFRHCIDTVSVSVHATRFSEIDGTHTSSRIYIKRSIKLHTLSLSRFHQQFCPLSYREQTEETPILISMFTELWSTLFQFTGFSLLPATTPLYLNVLIIGSIAYMWTVSLFYWKSTEKEQHLWQQTLQINCELYGWQAWKYLSLLNIDPGPNSPNPKINLSTT